MSDRIRHITLSHVVLPLANPVSDAKVLTGRQKPLTETVLLFVEVTTEQGLEGMGFSYSKRAGGRAQFAHLAEVADVAHRAGPVRHRPHLPVAAVGRRIGRPLGCGHPGDRRARRRAVGPQGPPRRASAGQTHRRPPRLLPRLQHLRRLPAGLRRRDQGEGHRLARVRHRRHQNQSGAAGLEDRPRSGRGDPRASRRHAADGRRQPAVGPGAGPPDVPRTRGASTWCGSRSRWTRGTPSATPTCQPHLRHPDRDRRDAHVGAANTWRCSTPATAASFSPTRRGSAGSPRSCGSPRWPPTPGWHWPRTMRWRSICTWRRRIPPSRGSSTSNGSTHCSTSASRFTTAGCGCPTGPASASRSATRCGRSPRRPPVRHAMTAR